MSARRSFFNVFPTLFNITIMLAMLVGSLALPIEARALGLAILVNTSADNTTSDGQCSLREAIVNANTNSANYSDCTQGASDDGIFFSDALGTTTITLGSALPPITDSAGLVINGGNDITVNGNNLHQVLRVHGAGSLTLDSLTVKNGRSAITNIGGGVYNAATLTIKNCTFLGNTATSGGAIFNGLGTLTIMDSKFLANVATDSGGAVYNEGGTVTVQNGSFSENTANRGGGIANTGNPAGTITITGATFDNNTSSESGGALHNDASGSVNITNVNLIENASSLGGAMYNLGSLTIGNSNISSNGAWYAGGIYNENGTLTLTESNFSKNVADFGGGIYNIKGTLDITSGSFIQNIGDGIFNENGKVNVLGNATFSGNQGNGIYSHSDPGITNLALLRIWDGSFTKNTGSGIYNDASGSNIFTSTFASNGNSGVYNVNESAVSITKSTLYLNSAKYGGGIYNEEYSILHVINSTIAENIAAAKGGGIYNDGEAYILSSTFSDNQAKYHGGVYNDMSGVLALYNTIVANSRESGDDCRNEPGGIVAGNNNLIEALSGDACGFLNGVDGNIIGLDPDLAMLTGSPAYYPLNSSSPAIDTGDDGQCAAASNESQNGIARPQGAHCDIGSYEIPSDKLLK